MHSRTYHKQHWHPRGGIDVAELNCRSLSIWGRNGRTHYHFDRSAYIALLFKFDDAPGEVLKIEIMIGRA